MTIQAWLDGREPAPPPALAARVRELASAVRTPGDDHASTCLAAAEARLASLVRQGEAGRVGALDLLAIDALVTYAFEAAAATPGSVPERAAEAMSRLSLVAAP